MKTIKSIALALALLSGTLVSAATVPVKKKEIKPCSEQIAELLEEPQFEVENELSAYVTFMLNDDNEIVVLDVETDNEQVERFVKARLNYQEIQTNLETGKQYNVPVRIVAAS
jgi:uncharacterized radical SAM superfamily protein